MAVLELSDNDVNMPEDWVIEKFMDWIKTKGFVIDSYCLGHKRGIDIVAHRTEDPKCKLYVEAKGTPNGSKNRQQVMGSYFNGAIGELYQRGGLADPDICNVILLPYNQRFKGLADRTNKLCNYRLGLYFAFVDVHGEVLMYNK